MDRWRGKTALVTGAASGIGEAITRALLRNGLNVAGLDIQYERLVKTAEQRKNEGTAGTLYPVLCDVSSEGDVEKAFSYVETTLGGVDVMVNNAGVVNYTRVIESDRKAFERLLNINVLAVAVCTNRAVRSMRVRNVEGHIFNVNSVLGHKLPDQPLSQIDGCNGWNLYPTTKHGTVALTKTVRKELSEIGLPIRVTSISPGLVKTEIAKDVPPINEFVEKIPVLLPDDVADAIIYALGTRAEVEITELTIQRRGEA